jgi:hypothetical protein
MRRTLFSTFLVAGGLATILSCSGKSGTDTPSDDPNTSGGSGGGASSGTTTTGAGGDVSSGTGGGNSTTTGAGGASSNPGGPGGPPIDLGPKPTDACPAITINQNAMITGYATDQFVWRDAACQERQSAMVRAGGGYVRQFVYDLDGKPRVVTGTGANGHTGWGYTVNHYGGGATVGKDGGGTFKVLYAGKHHAIYQYNPTPNIAGKDIPVTLQWFFATGRDNPVLAITYDMTKFMPGSIGADTRTPYGDMGWDGDENAKSTVVDGVGWGDHYKFVTTTAPLTNGSKWDYSQKNTIPYAFEWTSAQSDAEMGAVQTQTYLQHDAGSAWFYKNWGKTSDNQAMPLDMGTIGIMPINWNWPYQLDQYELTTGTTGSHRLAWGTNYGAIGGDDASGKYKPMGSESPSLVGYPYQSYSVFMVLGKHTDQKVFAQVSEIETVQKTHLTATTGTVPTMGPGGVGRTDMVKLDPPGYDQRYSVWTVGAANNQVKLHVALDAGGLKDPVLLVTDFSSAAPPSVKVDGAMQTADVDYLMSLDAMSQNLWITFRPGWTGAHDIEIQ